MTEKEERSEDNTEKIDDISKYYPIPLEEIRVKVEKRNGRNERKNNILSQLTIGNIGYPNVKEQINELGERVVRVDGEIPVGLSIENGQHFLFISYDQTALTHGLHKYPAKFFPELPRWLIKRYSKEGDIILDPFLGSGTTNVEALLNKRHSVGIDVDPFSRYLSKVKTTPLDKEALKQSQEELLKIIEDFNPTAVDEKTIPTFPYRDNWFNEEITLELAYIRNNIEELDFNQEIRDFYRICFSSIIRSVSNADNNCTRTVIRKKLNKKICPSDALTKFVKTILTNIPKMIAFSIKCPDNIDVKFPEDNDARDIKYPENYFNLAVTSPPYANALDYPRTHQLEIYWLGLANGSLTPLKKKHVGTESVSVEEYKLLHEIGIAEADKVISKIYKKDPRRAYITYKYLKDMKANLKEVYKVLKDGGRYIIVVGNNRIRGEILESWRYILTAAEEECFKVDNFFSSEIIRHFIKVPREERIDTDWVLVLSK